MKFKICVLIAILSSCGTPKSGVFSCSCEILDHNIGVKEVTFEYAKGMHNEENSELYAFFSINQNEKECYQFIFYFDKMNDTLQQVGYIEGYQKFTSPNLQNYLENRKKLKLKITNSCNSISHVYNVKCVELKDRNKIRGH